MGRRTLSPAREVRALTRGTAPPVLIGGALRRGTAKGKESGAAHVRGTAPNTLCAAVLRVREESWHAQQLGPGRGAPLLS